MVDGATGRGRSSDVVVWDGARWCQELAVDCSVTLAFTPLGTTVLKPDLYMYNVVSTRNPDELTFFCEFLKLLQCLQINDLTFPRTFKRGFVVRLTSAVLGYLLQKVTRYSY